MNNTESMLDVEYTAELQKLMLCLRVIKDIDYVSLCNTLTHIETIAPLFHPSEYMKGANNLREQGEILRAVKDFWELSQKWKEKLV